MLFSKDRKISQFSLIAALAVMTFASGCGGSHNYASDSKKKSRTPSSSVSSEDEGLPIVDSGNGINVSNPGTSAPESEAATSGTSPTYLFSVNGVGFVSKTFTVKARKVLKVQFLPGINSAKVAGTGFSPQYAQFAVVFNVNGTEQPTSLLRNGTSGSAQHSRIYDMSTSIKTSTCTANSPASCRETVTVRITKPQYDYWCYNYGQYCPYTEVYQGHPWNGTVMIQTDDTMAL